jgi:hypothetical protein
MRLGPRLVFLGAVAGACAFAIPLEAQRQRAPSRQESEGESRTAREREAPPARTAQPREAPAPAETPAPAEASRSVARDRDADRQDGGRRGGTDAPAPVTIRPVVIAPVTIERTVIQPVVITPPAVTHERDDAERRRRETVYDSRAHSAVVVVQEVPSSEAGWEVVDVSEAPSSTGAAMPLAPRSELIPFEKWYAVTEQVIAGLPVPYPEIYANTYDRARFIHDLDAPDPREQPERISTGAAIMPGAPLVPYAPGTFGGLSFDISPGDTLVYIDGQFVGATDDYAPDGPPLPLPAKTHKVELRSRGYRTEAFEVMVPLGQVLPLSGALVTSRAR